MAIFAEIKDASLRSFLEEQVKQEVLVILSANIQKVYHMICSHFQTFAKKSGRFSLNVLLEFKM